MNRRTDSSFRMRIVVAVLLLIALAITLLLVPFALTGQEAPFRLPESLTAVALVLAAAAGWLCGRDRAVREPGSAGRWVSLITVAVALLFLGRAALTLLGSDLRSPVALLLALGVDVAGPFVLAGVAVLTWPGELERHERRTVVADTGLGALGLVIIWVAVVLPATPEGGSLAALVLRLTATGLEFAAALLVLVLAAAARRRNRLTIVQVVLLHLSVLLFVGADVVADTFPMLDRALASAVATAGSVAAAAAFCAFALRRVDERETAGLLWLRDAWSTLIPVSPLPIAAGVLLFTLASGQAPSLLAAVTIAAVLLVVLVGVVWLRLIARAECRRAAMTAATATFTQATDQAWFQALIGNSRDIVLVVDRRGLVVYASPSFCAHLGSSADEVLGRALVELVPDLTVAAVRGAQRFPDRPAVPVEVALVDHAGAEHDVQFHVAPLSGLGMEGYVLTGQDITDARRMRILLGESRRRDRFTGLLNADAFANALEEAQGWSDPRSLAVLMFELCDLRSLNDARGRVMGEAILKAVAAALEQAAGPILAVGRVGFDGFAVLLRDRRPDVAVSALHAWLTEGLDHVAVPGEGTVRVRIAAGYSTAFSESERASELLEQADLAATRSLATPQLPLVRYEHEMRESLLQQWDQVAELEHALEFGEFVPHYQPIVRLRDGAVVSVEALARRMLPDGGVQLPDEFIPLAERVGLVARIDATIRSAALADIRTLRRRWPGLSVSINVAPAVFRTGFGENLVREVDAAGVAPEAVVFEVTESTVAESVDVAQEILQGLRRHGCAVALDDFGTGFSSLDALRTMDLDILKIDQVFVTDLAVSPRTLAVMRAITEIGRGLDMITVAEGVRSVEQADLLRGMGCDRVQGYLHAAPMTLAELERWLGGRRPRGRVTV